MVTLGVSGDYNAPDLTREESLHEAADQAQSRTSTLSAGWREVRRERDGAGEARTGCRAVPPPLRPPPVALRLGCASGFRHRAERPGLPRRLRAFAAGAPRRRLLRSTR